MSIDLDKNKESILQVYNDVLDDKTSTDWALFGYEGQTNILKVVGFGDDGLEELSEDLNASKIMYGVIRLTDPKTSRTKIVLINWQGEAAPNLRKGVCARHLPEVKRMLKGVHITISARTEEDVDTSIILNAVAKATATEYNFNERSVIPDKNVPVKPTFSPSICLPSFSAPSYLNSCCLPNLVLDTKTDAKRTFANEWGTNYKRTNPQKEIDANKRNRFWEEQEAEEKIRKELEIKKREEEAKVLEKERMDREVRESKMREQINKERNAKIFAGKKAETLATERTKPKEDVKVWEKEVESQHSEEIERSRRADQMRMERKKEAESLIGKSTHLARSMFEPQPFTQQSYSSAHPLDHKKRPPRVLKEFNPAQNELSLNSKESLAPKRSIGSRWPPVGSAEEEEVEKLQAAKVPGRISEWKPQTEDANNQLNKSTRPNDVTFSKSELPYSSLGQHQYSITAHFSQNSLSTSLNDATSSSPSLNESYSKHSTTFPSLDQSSFKVESPYTSNSTEFSTAVTSQEVETVAESHSVTSNITQTQTVDLSSYVSPSSSTSNQSIITHTKESSHSNSPKSYEPHSPTSPRSPTIMSSPEHLNGVCSTVDAEAYSNGIAHSKLSDILLQEETPTYQDDVDSFAMTYEVDGVEYQILPEHGLCARALYDYQAADETEITFDPGDIITNIDQIDIGWWQGVNSLGMFGLFPANYVELINGTKEH